MTLKEMIEKCKKLDPKIWISLYVIFSIGLLYWYPPVQVSHFEINNATSEATLVNQYRATLAQILGGGAILVGIYFAWRNLEVAQATLKSDQEKSQRNLEIALATLDSNMKNAQENLKVAQKGQITERFTRAVDQLGTFDQSGNPAIEIRLGGIYALERIANESDEDYWPIMEIFMAYIRKNSPIENHKEYWKYEPLDDFEKNDNARKKFLLFLDTKAPISLDIQAILTVIARRRHFFGSGEPTYLVLEGVNLREGQFNKANLKWAHLSFDNLKDAYFFKANLEMATLIGANLQNALLKDANLIAAFLIYANLKGAYLKDANLKGAYLEGANFERANLEGANLEGANLEGANLKRASNLTIEQLSKVKTLYNAQQLDEELLIPLKEKYPTLFEKPKDEQ